MTACSGFGFVSFYTLEECEKALQGMNGGECDGRAIRVEKAKRNSGYSKTPGVCKYPPHAQLVCWFDLPIDEMHPSLDDDTQTRFGSSAAEFEIWRL